MSEPTFRWESVIHLSPSEVFAWHTRPGAFERFNPPWRPVKIIKAPRSLRDGESVQITVPIIGNLGIPWRLIHRDYRENEQFCDEQVSGPFRSWRHIHRFIPDEGSSCLMRDEIYFEPLFGITPLRWFISRELTRLFRYRHMVLTNDLALHARFKDKPRKTVLVSGSSGFIGSALCAFLSTAGHEVIRLVRRAPAHENERQWDPESLSLDPAVFDGVDVVIHLGGAGIADKRWTADYKREILESRRQSSKLLCSTIARLSKKPESVIMASATGYYGDTKDTLVDESSPVGTGFLAETCVVWESSARDALQETTRLVNVRIGTVLDAGGGALKKMLPAFKFGMGGALGDGQQYMSWIALQDLLGIFEHVIYTPSIQGPVNAVAPTPSTNREFTDALGHALHRPTFMTVPAPALRAMFGEIADEALLASSRVAPKALVESGYVFQCGELDVALRSAIGV